MTPGSASALDVSIFLMIAWACGLVLRRAYSMPGNLMSALYCANPVTLSMPSGRIGLVPMIR